ncbi:MAG: hypothetical protein ABFC73_01200 [Clostridiaceae bacterium]
MIKRWKKIASFGIAPPLSTLVCAEPFYTGTLTTILITGVASRPMQRG